jgi:hypothetical protein
MFSVCSFIYALFYAIIMISNTKIDYVEDIVSLNIQKIKESGADLGEEAVDLVVDKSYHAEQLKGE